LTEPVDTHALSEQEVGQFEQDLADFQQRLKQSFHVLDNLSNVQQKFEDLTQTYQKFQSYTAEAQAVLAELTQAQGSSDRRVEALESNLEMTGREIRIQLLEIQTELREGDRNLKAELVSQIGGLKSDLGQNKSELEQNKAVFQEDWERQREAVRDQLEKLRDLLTNELRTLHDRFNEVKNGTQDSGEQLERLEKLESSFRKTKSAFHETGQRVATVRMWAILAIFLGALGLCLGAFSFWFAYNRPASPAPGTVRLEP